MWTPATSTRIAGSSANSRFCQGQSLQVLTTASQVVSTVGHQHDPHTQTVPSVRVSPGGLRLPVSTTLGTRWQAQSRQLLNAGNATAVMPGLLQVLTDWRHAGATDTVLVVLTQHTCMSKSPAPSSEHGSFCSATCAGHTCSALSPSVMASSC